MCIWERDNDDVRTLYVVKGGLTTYSTRLKTLAVDQQTGNLLIATVVRQVFHTVGVPRSAGIEGVV
jgi:hypothetical protein